MTNHLSRKFLGDKRNYVLKNNKERSHFFGELTVYIKKLMSRLWNDPKMISNILLNSSNENVKNSLANFFVNNFYDNIFSSNSIENNLLYLIALLLKEEIKNLINKEKPESFLDSSICGYILEQLRDKKDIKIYFKIMVSNILEKLDSLFSKEEIIFNSKKYKDTSNNENNLINFNKNSKKNILQIENNNDNHKHELFISKYMKSLKEEDLKAYLTEYENKTKKTNMKDYINYIMKNAKTTSYLYDTKIISKIITNDETTNVYEDHYYKISELIDFILNYLLNNLNLMPYSLKCICKIISQLIQNHFPNIDLVKKNAFIAKFFFHILFSNMLTYPSYLSLINDFYLTRTHKKNVKTISEIFKQLSLGQLFKDDNIEGKFTLFNWMIIEKMPKLIELFENFINVKLPDFIEKLIDGNLNEDYKYDYFEENKNEVMIYKSICFSVDDIYFLVKNMKKSKEKIFQNIINNEIKKIIEKLFIEDNFNKLKSLKNSKEKQINKEIDSLSKPSTKKNKNKKNEIIEEEKKDENNELPFFLFTELDINKKYDDKNIENEKGYLYIPIKKENEKDLKEEEKMSNIINRAKNFLCAILYNYRTLNKDDFIEGKCSTISSILDEIKKYMKSLNILIDSAIPFDWYIDSLLDYLKKLPKKLVNNDYEEFIKQIENDINYSINNLHLQDISIFFEKIKCIKDLNIYYDNNLKLFDDILINIKTQKIINNSRFNIEMIYKKDKIFTINQISNNNNGNNKNHNNEKKITICSTIEEFINHFPDITKSANHRKISNSDLLRQLKIPEAISKYLKIIYETIQREIEDPTESKRITINIFDYFMEKIYSKIFPTNIDDLDNMINLNCNKANWVGPKDLIKGKDYYIYGNFISDVTECIEKINQQKCPRKKFIYLEDIFRIIHNLALFNGDNLEGLDEEIQFLNYALLKAKPKTLSTNCEYMRNFIGDKKGKREDNHLTQITIISKLIAKLSHSFFINISESEFNEKCQKNLLNSV